MPFEAARSISITPGAAITKGRFVKIVSGKAQMSANTEDAVGIALEAATAADGPAIPIALLDGAKLEVTAGAAIAIGARVMSDANGKAITATGATARVLGFALQAAAADLNVITIIGRPAAGEFVA